MLAQGKPHCYRFRVPSNKIITITDSIRGKVSWNTDSLGDFVVMRSNGLPVYNFCVAVDDATMKISHVIRAEEHLPNTLRQVSLSSVPALCDCPDRLLLHVYSHIYDCMGASLSFSGTHQLCMADYAWHISGR